MIALTSGEGTLRICVLRGELTTVRVEGELDTASTDVLMAAASMVPDSAAAVSVDLGGLTFLDDTGADALAAFHAAQVVRGRTVRLTRVGARIRRFFAIRRMGSLMSVWRPRGVSRPVPLHRPPAWLRTTPLPESQDGPPSPPR